MATIDSEQAVPPGMPMHTAGAATAALRWEPWREWAVLLVLQALLAYLVLGPFIDGRAYFAYVDIGSDTYHSFSATAMHLARMFGREGWSGWSFGIGLGAPTALMFGDQFRLLTQVGGAEHVLELRIWVYLLKMVLGGGFFFLLARPLVARRESALIAALIYSFCGYMTVNGQWDPEANAFVFFPLVAWALMRLLQGRGALAFAAAVAATLVSGLFIGILAISIGVAFLASLALAQDRRATLRRWLTQAVPMGLIGVLLAAPFALPATLQLLDSPRVAGGQSLLERLAAGWLISPAELLAELGGLFHKDIFNTGDLHKSYLNYLESPEFYVGLMPLMLLPQLWKGSARERRILLVTLAGVALYLLVPQFRLAAYGFAAPYYRATCLWVALPLLLAGMLALDRVLERGVDARMLGAGGAAVVGVFALLWLVLPYYLWQPHVVKVVAFLAVWLAVFGMAAFGRLPLRALSLAVAVVAIAEVIAFAWPSYVVGRGGVTPDSQRLQDGTLPALEAIRRADSSLFYRVEKTYDSIGKADALGQDYRGVKSYYYHGKATVDFYRNLGLLGRDAAGVSTNWLSPPYGRYFLQSVLGVKYLVTRGDPLDLPGFERMAEGPGWQVYQNELALPLGVVHTHQVTRAEMNALAKHNLERELWFKDAALVNAVVLDELQPQWGRHFDIASLAARGNVDVWKLYVEPARALQRTGLQVTSFRNDRIQGRIQPTEPGILVFSIPAYKGWQLRIDGEPRELMVADFGMLAAPVTAGAHAVELSYELPGLRAGLALFVLGAALFAAFTWRARRSS